MPRSAGRHDARPAGARPAQETTRAAQETTSANLRTVRELVLDDTRMGALLDRRLPGTPGSAAAPGFESAHRDGPGEAGCARRVPAGGEFVAGGSGVKGAVEQQSPAMRPRSGASWTARNEDGFAHELLSGRLAGTMRASPTSPNAASRRGCSPPRRRGDLDRQDPRIAAELAALPNRDCSGTCATSSPSRWWIAARRADKPRNLSALAALANLNMFEGLVHEDRLARRHGGDMTPPRPTNFDVGRQAATLADTREAAQRRDLARQNTLSRRQPCGSTDRSADCNVAARRTPADRRSGRGASRGGPDRQPADNLLTRKSRSSMRRQGKPEESGSTCSSARQAQGPFYIERRVAFERLEMPTLRPMMPTASSLPTTRSRPD